MTIQEFIINVEKISPLKEVYFENKNRIMPQVIVDSYKIQEREGIQKRLYKNDDILCELIENFQSEKITFGDYGFLKGEIYIKNDLNIFCYSSHSFLAYKDPKSEIVEYDNDLDNTHVIHYCAQNCVAFLKAIICLLEMYSLRLQGSIQRNDIEKNLIFLNRCILNAGGEKYSEFYKSIIF